MTRRIAKKILRGYVWRDRHDSYSGWQVWRARVKLARPYCRIVADGRMIVSPVRRWNPWIATPDGECPF